VIDTYGIRVAVGIGAALTESLACCAGLAAPNLYPGAGGSDRDCSRTAFISTPNHQTGGRWFPIQERATASAGSLAVYVGIVAGWR